MADMKIQSWSKPLRIEDARGLVGEVINVAVVGEITCSGTSWPDLFRLARVLSVRERTPSDVICQHCGETSRIAFDVEWESGFTEARAREVCEHCMDGHVTEGSDSLTFAGGV